MNAISKSTIALARSIANNFDVLSVNIKTPDGREWSIVTIEAGRGRYPDGHWGPVSGSSGGFRLFEIDQKTDAPIEHDSVNGNLWSAGDLSDYLHAVGRLR